MVGNVTGISLLETVGVSAPQTAAESVPNQNFADVMLQAGNETGTPLPGPQTSVAPQAKEPAIAQSGGSRSPRSANDTPSAQSEVAKPDVGAKGERVTQPAGKATTGLQSNAKLLKWTDVGTAQNVLQKETVPAAGAVQTEDVNVGRLKGVDASAVIVTDDHEVSSVTVAAPVTGELAMTDLAAVAKDSGVRVGLPQGADKGNAALQPVGVTKKSSKETVSLESKPVGKPVVDSKGDSKLTALVPQGTATTPQSDPAALSLNGTTALLVPVVTDQTEPAPTKNIAEVSTTGVAILPGEPTKRMAAQAAGSPLVGNDVAGAVSIAAASTKVTPLAAAGFTSSVPQDVQPTTGKTAVAAKSGDAPLAAPAPAQATDVLRASLVQDAQNQPALPALPEGRAEVPGAGVQPQAATTGFVAEPVKQAVQASSNGVGSVKNAEVAVAAPMKSGQSTTEAAPVGPAALPPAVAKPPTTAGVITVPGDAAAVKMQDAAPLPVRRSAPQAKTVAAVDGLAANPAGSKEAVVAPAAPGFIHPVTSPADHSGVGTPVAVPLAAANSLPSSQIMATSPQAGVSIAGSVSPVGQMGTASDGGLSHTTLSSTPTTLEVGVSSGTHGWLKIRAELNAAGEVNASLTGTNTAAAEKLRGDLPALSSFLQAEKVPMGTLDVRAALHTVSSSFEGGSMFSQSGSGQSGSGQTGSGQTGQGSANGAPVSADAGASGERAQQQAPQDTSVLRAVDGVGTTQDKVLPGRNSDAAVYGIHTELGGSEASPSLGYGTGGGWLNVRA